MLLSARRSRPLPKSTFGVYGANHNFYNTEWQESDSPRLRGPGNMRAVPAVRRLGGAAADGGRQPGALHAGPCRQGATPDRAGPVLNPDRPLPGGLTGITPIDRGYTDTPDRGHRPADRGLRPGPGTGGSGQPATGPRDLPRACPACPDHDALSAPPPSPGPAPAGACSRPTGPPPGTGRSLSRLQDTRVPASRGMRRCVLHARPASLNVTGTDFTVQLVRPNGSLSAPVRLARYLSLRGPVGLRSTTGFRALAPDPDDRAHPLVRLRSGRRRPDPGRAVHVRPDAEGAIYLANIRLSKRRRVAAEAVALAAADSAGIRDRRPCRRRPPRPARPRAHRRDRVAAPG